MRVTSDEPPGASTAPTKPPGFWQNVARALDEFFIDRTKRAVPEGALRRSSLEIRRCRRLILKGSMTPAEARVAARVEARAARVSSRRAAQATQPR